MDLTQLSSNLKLKTDFNAGSTFGLRDISSVTGIVDNSVTSLQALIFSNDNVQDFAEIDPTSFDVTGITSGYDNKCFVFDIKKEYKFVLSSDITDHYVEDNVAIQDHIGLKPIILEVNGSIGEIDLKSKQSFFGEGSTTKENKNLFNSVDSYLGRMGSLTSFAPNIVNQALDLYNTSKYVYNTANKFIDFAKKDIGDTKQSSFKYVQYTEQYNEERIQKSRQFSEIDWFKTQWEHRASFTIITPYGKLENMYIVDLSASQPENSRYVTNLSIKFKQIKKAKIVRRANKLSRTLDTQTKKQEKKEYLTITTPEVYYDIQKAMESPKVVPPTQPGGVTQVTPEQFEEYKEIVSQALTVDKIKGVYTETQIANNLSFFGNQQTNSIGKIGGFVF